jgi:signal transduction histidine kinase
VEPLADRAWLADLGALLAPLQPAGLALVDGFALSQKFLWVSRLPAEVVPRVSELDALGERSGWRFQLDPRQPEAALLFVASATGRGGEDPLPAAAATLVRCAWRLRQAEGGGACDDRSDLAEAIHALRNSLNSVLMSAAVITTCADLLPERLQPIAREIEAAAERSVQRLHRLTAVIDAGV